MNHYNLDIKQNIQHEMFFVRVPGGVAFLKYKKPSEHLIEYFETYVPSSSRKRGVAGELVKHGLEYAKSRNLEVYPTCPFVKKFISKNPEYKPVLHDYN